MYEHSTVFLTVPRIASIMYYRLYLLQESRFNGGAGTVCVGIDVYGRSEGPAGWQTHEAMKKVDTVERLKKRRGYGSMS